MAKRSNTGPYHFLVTIPDRLYPFGAEVRGRWVRGTRAYNQALARAFRLYGTGSYGYKLSLYRGIFHIIGAAAVIIFAAYVSQNVFGTTTALYVVLALAVLLITFQEFYLQRRLYAQLWKKGVLDWCTWVVPIGAYLFSHVK